MSSTEERRAELRRSIADSRRSIQAAISDFRSAARHDFSLADHVAERPWRWIGAACVAGLILGYRHSI